jgi:hypothetical protein
MGYTAVLEAAAFGYRGSTPLSGTKIMPSHFEFTHLPVWRRLSNGVYRHSRHDFYSCCECPHFLTQHVFVNGRWTCMAGMGCMCIHQLERYSIQLREEDLLRVKDIEDLEDQFEPRPE